MSRWRRQGATYIFYGYDPHVLLKGKLRIIVLYVGKSRRRVETRWREHMVGAPGVAPKVWAPLVTEQQPLKEWGRITDWWLSVREAWSISWHRPRANILLNKANPRRIPPWEMQRVMARIEGCGGVTRLVDQARADVGWRVTPDGAVEWYGKQVGSR